MGERCGRPTSGQLIRRLVYVFINDHEGLASSTLDSCLDRDIVPYNYFRKATALPHIDPHHPSPTLLSGARERFFFLGGGGKSVDMPSDCQNLGGGAQTYPSH